MIAVFSIADGKRRLIIILLTRGEAHDCAVADRLIRRVKPSQHMLSDQSTTAPNCAASSMNMVAGQSFPNNSPRLSK
jgi:hypothetical protein